MCEEVCELSLLVVFGTIGTMVVFATVLCGFYHMACKKTYSRNYNAHAFSGWMNSATILKGPKKKGDYLKNLITDRFLYQTHIKDSAEQDLKELKAISPVIEDSCVICLMKYNKDPSQVFVGLLKNCGHYFHFGCIWEWLQQKQNCPVCRKACILDEVNLKGFSLEKIMKCNEDTYINADEAMETGGTETSEATCLQEEHCRLSEVVCTTEPNCGLSKQNRNNFGVSDLPEVEGNNHLNEQLPAIQT